MVRRLVIAKRVASIQRLVLKICREDAVERARATTLDDLRPLVPSSVSARGATTALGGAAATLDSAATTALRRAAATTALDSSTATTLDVTATEGDAKTTIVSVLGGERIIVDPNLLDLFSSRAAVSGALNLNPECCARRVELFPCRAFCSLVR